MLLEDIKSPPLSRKAVLKALRKEVNIASWQTYSEPQKNSRMVKFYGVSKVDKLKKEIEDFIKRNKIPGVTVRTMVTGDGGHYMTLGRNVGVRSIALQFDNKLYGE